MDFSGEAAMEELRACEADLRTYADERGLTVKSDPPYPGAPVPEEQPGPVKHAVWSLVGKMPGGSIAKLRHQATFGQMAGMNATGHHTVMVARQPETVGYVPMLSMRPDEFGAGLFYWAGDGRARQKQTFESLELERRYVIEVAKGQEQVWLFRLFTPSLIDWLAEKTPPDFAFRLSSGSFVCEAPQWRGQHRKDGQVDVDHLDLLAENGGRVAGRLRDEVLEQVGLGSVPRPRSAQANSDWSGGRRHGRFIGSIMKLAGAGGSDDSARLFAEARGFEPGEISEFHSTHMLLPLPAAASDVFHGDIPGDARGGTLAWLEYENEIDGIRYYVAVIGKVGESVPAVWLDAEEVLAVSEAPGLPAGVTGILREGGYGISTGGGFAALYLSSTGWEGRPSGESIDRLLEASGQVFNALNAPESVR